MQRRKWRLYCPSGFKVSLHLNLTVIMFLLLLEWREKPALISIVILTILYHDINFFSIRSYILQWLPERVFCCFALLACVQSLVPVNSPPMCGRLAVRMQMARDLLSGELRILKSASMWLKSYCTTLTTTAYHCEDVGDYRAIPGWTRELSDTGVSHELHGKSA